jgi:hypothetical protein
MTKQAIRNNKINIHKRSIVQTILFFKKKIHSTLYNLTVIMVTMIDIVQQGCKERGILLS